MRHLGQLSSDEDVAPTYLNLHLHRREVEVSLPASAPVTLCGLGGG